MFELAWPWLLLALPLPWIALRVLPRARNGWVRPRTFRALAVT